MVYQNPAKLRASKLCLQRVCIVESCRKTRAQGVQLFRLPHNPSQLRKWMHNIRTRPRGSMRSQYRICSRHFETHSFNGRRLSAGAIPTLELGHDDDDIYPNEAQAFVDEHCAVEGCGASKEQPEVRLFRFPTDDDDMLWKWCNNLKMNPADCTGVRICNKHFEADCIGPKHLFKWAIPTQELGHDDAQIELIPNPKPEDRYVDPVFKCVVPTCGKTRRFDEVQMNSFPKDPELFQRWRHNLRLDHLHFHERERYKICNAHFEDVCIGKTRLNIGSIPTLELGHDETEDLFQVNPAELQSNLFGRQRRLLDGSESGEVVVKQELPDDETEPEDIKPDIRELLVSRPRQVKAKKGTLGSLKCCVRSCGRSRLQHGARLFAFPTGKQQHLKWRHNLRLEPEDVDRSTRVCSAHFNRRCIDGKQLRSWAMPTLQLGHREQPIYENPKNIPGFFTPTCALSHCRQRRSIDNDLRTYRYPRTEDLLEKWRANLRLTPDQCRGRICADHFEPLVRGKLKLKTGAVPTLKLGHDEGLIFDNEAIKAGMAAEEEEVTCKQELVEEEEEGEESPEGVPAANEDDDDKDDSYFDPLELVETFAERASDEEAEDHEVEEKNEPDEGDEEEAEELLPDLPPTPPPVPQRREKPANNVTPICCLKHCRKERTAFHLLSTFGFPKDRKLLLKWCANLHLHPDDTVGRVCIEHFEPEVLGTRKLKQNAVPTLNLGHDDPLRYTCHGVEQDQDLEHGQPQHSVFRLWSLKHCRKRKLSDPPDIRPSHWKELKLHMQKQRQMEMAMKMEMETDILMSTPPQTPVKIKPKRCCVISCGSEDARKLVALPDERSLLRRWQHNLKLSMPADPGLGLCLDHFEESLVQFGKPMERAVPTLKLDHKSRNLYRNNATCLVPSCPSSGSDSTSFVGLPLNSVMKRAWLSYLQLPFTSDGLLCGNHFVELYEQVDLPEDLPVQDLEELERTVDELQCAVPGCASKNAREIPVQLVQLPHTEKELSKWLHNTKITYDYSRHGSYRICLLHFDPICLDEDFPQSWAVPTMNLGHDDQIHSNPVQNQVAEALNGTSNSHHSHGLIPLRIKTELASSPSVSASPSPRGNIRVCCIPTCGQFGNSQVRLYRFPSEEQFLLQWLVNTQQQPRLVDPMDLYVCQAHFETDATYKKHLRSWALPTLNLGHDGHVFQNARHNGNTADVQDVEEATKFIRERYCSVLSCFQLGGEGVRLFEYPEDMGMIRKWAVACKHRSMHARSHGLQVCQAHFSADCFDLVTGGLLEGSIPTLELSREDIERHCLVPGCEQDDAAPRLRFYKLPKIGETLEAWSINIKIPVSELKRGDQRICERHFETYCFGPSRGLRLGALPTLFLGHEDLLRNPENLRLGKQENCCVPGCGRIRQTDDIPFYSFPKHWSLARKWMHNLRLEKTSKDQLNKLRVCPAHFESDVRENDGLLPEAMPTKQLGHSSEGIFLTDKGTQARSLPNLKKSSLEVICCYPDCTDSSRFQLLDFPDQAELREAWLGHLHLKELQNEAPQLCPLHYVILYEHSAKEFPEHVPDQLMEENYTNARANRRVKIVSCAIKGCRTVRPRDGVPLHGMPIYKDILQMWVDNGQVDFSEHQRYMLKVCRRHFEARCFVDERRLCSWSVPTLHLPGETIHQNPSKEEWEAIKRESKEEPEIKEEPLEPETEMEVETDNSLLEPVVKMEHLESEEEDSEMQALEVLLEVGHVERLDSYEKIDDVIYNSNRGQYNANSCAVEGCDVTAEDVGGTIKLHKFPAPAEAARKWMHNTQVDMEEKFWWRYRICSYHFHQDCFQGSRIRKGAMPTLLLGPRRPDEVYDNEFASQPDVKEPPLPVEIVQTGVSERLVPDVTNLCLPPPAAPRKSSKFCQIEGCSNHLTTDNITLHKFPHSEEMCVRWQHNSQVPFDPNHRWRYRICTAHFEPVCLSNLRLLHGSVPTLKLGPKAPAELFDNDFEAINQRLDKRSAAEVKQERVDVEDELHEDQMDVPSLMPVKQEKVSFNQIKSGYDKCSLAHCQRQRSLHGVHIYKFPRSQRQQERWMHNLRIRYDERRPWRFMICSVHFEPHCISLRKLRPWAVPTLELGTNVPEIIFTNEQCQELEVEPPSDRSEAESEEEDGLEEDDDGEDDEAEEEGQDSNVRIKKERRSRLDPYPPGQAPPWKVKQCCLPYCRAFRGDGIKLFRLPNNRTSIHNWELATGMVFKESQRNTRLICSRHFDPELIGVRRLMRNAIPTLHLNPESVKGKEKKILQGKPKETPSPIPTCCMADCHHNGNAKLHKFPNDSTHLRQWCQALRLTDIQRYRGKYICSAHLPTNMTVSCVVCGVDDVQLPMLDFPENRNQRAKWCYNLKIETIPKWDRSKHICCRHFESHCFVRPGELRPGATPTVALNHNDTNIFLSDYATDPTTSYAGNQIKDEPMDGDETLLV